MGTKFSELRIDFERLRGDLLALGEIGRNRDRGVYRMAFTDADMEGKRWLMRRIEEAGLVAAMDGAGNVSARLEAPDERPCVLAGSHIDSVPNGGIFDGALGVLAAVEALRRMREAGVETVWPVEAIAFSDEEGRFGGMFGSQAVAGELDPERIHLARDLSGVTVIEAMGEHGLDAMDALQARRDRRKVAAYVELHIEQGPVLDTENVSAGVVEEITGLFKWSARLHGVANHAGTTPMEMRRDPFSGLAEFAGEIPRILEEHGSDLSRATIGRVDLRPGAANTIPGEVVFSLDVRDIAAENLEALHDAFRRTLSAIGRRRSLMFDFEILSRIEPVACDRRIVEAVEGSARRLAVPSRRMPSGAAHDAQTMAGLAPVGMIFVPSKGGISHSPAEWTAWQDVENGANILLQTLLQLANDPELPNEDWAAGAVRERSKAINVNAAEEEDF